VTRPSAVAGGAADWIAALHIVEAGRRKASRTNLNRILDNIIIAQDAEREARAATLRRLKPKYRIESST